MACVVFSTSLCARVGDWMQKRYPILTRAAAVVLNTVLLVLTLAVMM